jgi:hypothetical protein
MSGFKEFSAESKNTLVARMAERQEPLPPGKVLARLPFILTSANKAGMEEVFLMNLESPSAEARTASLYGLQELRHARLLERAERLLLDEADDVRVAACSLVLPRSKQDAALQPRLREIYAVQRDQPEYYGSNAMYEAHGFGVPPPASK